MHLTVALKMGNRTAVETASDVAETRQAFRSALSEAACRLELATFGPPGPVEEMTAEDHPFIFGPPNA